MTQQTRQTFAVIGADGVYQSDGRRIPLPAFTQLAYWLDAATRRNIDSLWLHPSAGFTWTDADIAACDPWQVIGEGDDAQGNPWWTATRPGLYGVRDVIQPRYEDRTPWRETPDAATLRDALLAFRQATGFDWRRSSGATGTRILRAVHSGAHATTLDLDGAPPAPATDGSLTDSGHIVWTRALRGSEHGGYLHSYDINGQYLAACSSLALGVGAWRHERRPILPPKVAGRSDTLLPGYYFVKAAEKAENGPAPSILTNHTGEWVTAPTLRLLREQGAIVNVPEAYTWAEHKRYLEPWYKTLKGARDALTVRHDPASGYALTALKQCYTHAVGWLGSELWDRSEDRLYRPDWAQQVRAQARANLLRTISRVLRLYGASPVAVGSDCVYYVSPLADPLEPPYIARVTQGCVGDGLRISKQLGHFKIKDAGVPISEVAELMRGRDWDLLALQAYLNVRNGRRAA